MNFAEVAHHAYDIYCYPLDKDHLQINIQTGKDVTEVFLLYGDPFKSNLVDGKWLWTTERVKLTECKDLSDYLWWSTSVIPEYKRCKYYFEIHSGQEIKLYFENGFFDPSVFKGQPDGQIPFIFPWMNEIDICKTPKWAESTVWYQIFPSRFNRGKNSKFDPTLKPWAGPNDKVRNEDQYGGDLQGIIDKLDYLHNLGINGLYLNPINLSRSQHKYDTTDYLEIDPTFGTKAILKNLVAEAHKRNMHVMLDGVFNHTGWDFFAWQDVVKNKEKSKYASWYFVLDYNFTPKPCDNAATGKFYSFAFTDFMPKLNTNNPEVRNYLLKVCETWVKEYDIDALRLDVANEISHVFCQELQQHMRSLKSDFFIVGEIWNNALPWLRGNEFDSVINYPLQTAIYDFALNKNENVKQLQKDLNHCLSMYYQQIERVLINQMDSHDTPRLVTKTGNKDTSMQQFALMFMLPGSACIYYGTEILLEGEHDPDNRRCMPWKEIERGDYDKELKFMISLISLRKNHPAITSFDTSYIYDDNDQTGNNRVVHIVKKDKESGETIHGVLNFGTKDYMLASTISNELLSNNIQSQEKNKTLVKAGGFIIYS